jgi:BioD-like phosphotransacetylase family protein
MKALYISSIENFSGKTAILLGIGKRLQTEGHQIGYLKPVSHQPTQLSGRVADEDATFVKRVLVLDPSPWELSPVVVTPELFTQFLASEEQSFEQEVKRAYDKAIKDKDILLIEGGGSLREGYAIGLSNAYVADMLDATAVTVVKYRGRMRLLDDSLTAQFRLQERLLGIIINRVPDDEVEYVQEQAIPFLEAQGIPVFGVIPERPQLAAISVGELIDTLEAKVLTGEDLRDNLVEHLMVGAMTAQEALSRFRRSRNKAVITGGDRTDIQLAALETSTVVMILTGNLRPSAPVVERAEKQGVAVLMVPTNTMDTVEAVERVYGKTRLGQAEKLARFEALMAECVDYKKLFEALEL